MIKSFKHKGLQAYFETGSKAGIQPHHANKLKLQLGLLDSAKSKDDANVPAWRLHELKDNLQGHYSIWVNGNWRLTFKFDNEDIELVDYQDYH
jgi:toxin HigB-1